MTIAAWLTTAVNQLTQAGIATARLDALVLLEDCLHINRSLVLAHDERQLTSQQLSQLTTAIKQRQQHEPLAYIRGKTEFYGRDFTVSHAVLEPRPESETMIDQLKALPLQPNPAILDVGTGSGALGITAALELPAGTTVSLLDIDTDALAVAQQNLDRYHLSLPTIQQDLLTGLTDSYDVLLCNLPYVPDDFQVNQAALREPHLAIFGGPDGLDVYRQLFKQARHLAQPPHYILTEALPPQHDELKAIAHANRYKQQQVDDFIQVFIFTASR